MTEHDQPGFFAELKRRNVVRAAAYYGAVAWLALQLVDVLGDIAALPDWVGRVLLIAIIVGFPVAMVLAWSFELTPEGIKRDGEVDDAPPFAVQSGRKLDFVVIAVLVAALAILLYTNFFSPRSPVESIETALEGSTTIAVLPFANRSAREDDVYFVDGIHDDILTQLAKINSLSVTSRTSVERFRTPAEHGGIREIATSLGVRNVLEGGVQRAGDRIRINVQLIDVREDAHLWAATYDRELTAANIFAVQGEIATSVADALRLVLAPAEEDALGETPTENLAAYDLYLLGRHHFYQGGEESLLLAQGYFEQALEEDPDYVPALSGLADSYLLLVNYGNLEGDDVFPIAEEIIDRAMALDDSVADVWASLGLLRGMRLELSDAERAFRRALEIDEKTTNAWHWYSTLLNNTRRYDESIVALENAYALEPMLPAINQSLADRYFNQGDFARARQFYERMQTLDEDLYVLSSIRVADMYFYEGEFARAITLYRDILKDSPGNQETLESLGFAYVTLGDISEARRWFLRSETMLRSNRGMYFAFEAAGDFDGAVIYLEDKLELDQNRRHVPTLDRLFRASYLGGNLSQAADYLEEVRKTLNGRFEVNPAFAGQIVGLLRAQFLIDHGAEFGLDSARGHEMVDEILSALLELRAMDMNRPITLLSLAGAWALKGNTAMALSSLDEAVDTGYRDFGRSFRLPMFNSLRDTEEFIAINNRMNALIEEQLGMLAQVEFEPYSLPEARQPIAMSREEFDRFAGFYSNGNALAHFYLADDGSYETRVGQLAPIAILPFEENKFFTPLFADLSATFFTDEEGEITHVMMGPSDAEQRFKRVAAPPPPVEVEREILERYAGNYVYERRSQVTEERTEADQWVALIAIGDDNQMSIDFDDQAILEIVPTSDTELHITGFDAFITMIVNPATGNAEQFELLQDGVLTTFDRQIGAED